MTKITYHMSAVIVTKRRQILRFRKKQGAPFGKLSCIQPMNRILLVSFPNLSSGTSSNSISAFA